MAPIGVKLSMEVHSSTQNFIPSVQSGNTGTKFAACIRSWFQNAIVVKIWMDSLKELRRYRGFKLRGTGFPRIFSAPNGKTMHWTPKSFRGARTCSIDVLCYNAKFGGALVSLAAGTAKNVKYFVCLSVTLLNVGDCAHDFAMKAERNNFDKVE